MRRPLALALSLAFLGTASAGAAEPKVQRWQVGGVEREALVRIPTGGGKGAPVVFAFHGHGGNMNQAARSFGLHALWPEAVVVSMQGLPTPGRISDPEGKRSGWQHARDDQGGRDLAFFDAVLASLKADHGIDPRRVYATGHSNGGAFTYLLWAERGESLAAVAPSGAAVAASEAKNLKPKPVLHVAGEADPLVKFAWQKATLDRVRKLDGCADAGTPWAKDGELVATLYPSEGGTPAGTSSRRVPGR